MIRLFLGCHSEQAVLVTPQRGFASLQTLTSVHPISNLGADALVGLEDDGKACLNPLGPQHTYEKDSMFEFWQSGDTSISCDYLGGQ